MSQSLPFLQQCAPSFFYVVLLFLAFPSQWLFSVTSPGPLTKAEAWKFNILVVCIAITYARTWLTDPGRIPLDWAPAVGSRDDNRTRWCRRCESFKPPRAHHCKTCGRCIPKMDHHCPWVANCVSHRTLPHFMRFLVFSVVASIYLEYFLVIRFQIVWRNRNLPSYLGPSMFQLTLLFLEGIVNTLTLFGMGIVLLRMLWSLLTNTTTIEGWEIERHETLVRRSKFSGGFLEASGGQRMKIVKQEFPWDLNIASNIAQGMGTWNFLAWLWPFAFSLPIDSGLDFPTNGLEDAAASWPPPDPDRTFRFTAPAPETEDFTPEWDVGAFRQRQEADLGRYLAPTESSAVYRRKPFHERLEEQLTQEKSRQEYDSEEYAVFDDDEESIAEPKKTSSAKDGEEGWRNSEGERLADYGVDEDAEFYDEDDLPLAVLLKMRKATSKMQ